MKNLLKKLLLISKEIEPMEKDGTNTMQNYQYLSEKKVKLNVRELLNKHGVVFMHSSKIDDFTQIGVTSKGTPNWATKVHVDYKFYDAESGEMLEGWYEAHGTDTGDKGAFKATTGAVKNILMQNFLIPTGDDPEKESKGSNQQSPAKSKEAKKEAARELSEEQVKAILVQGGFTIHTAITKTGKNAGKPWFALDDAESQRGWIKELTYKYILANSVEKNGKRYYQKKDSKGDFLAEADKIFNPQSEEGKANAKHYANL